MIRILACLLALLPPIVTLAHDAPSGWSYPPACCSGVDCRPAGEGGVREVSGGYLVVATGEVVPFGDRRIRPSPDGLFHACHRNADFKKGKVICIFAPPQAF